MIICRWSLIIDAYIFRKGKILQLTSAKLLRNTLARINHSKYFFSTRTRTLQRNLSQQKCRGENGFHSGQSIQYSGRQSSISIMYRVGCVPERLALWSWMGSSISIVYWPDGVGGSESSLSGTVSGMDSSAITFSSSTSILLSENGYVRNCKFSGQWPDLVTVCCIIVC